jgi:hypothetical protein
MQAGKFQKQNPNDKNKIGLIATKTRKHKNG